MEKTKNRRMDEIEFTYPETVVEERFLNLGVELGVLERVDSQTWRTV